MAFVLVSAVLLQLAASHIRLSWGAAAAFAVALAAVHGDGGGLEGVDGGGGGQGSRVLDPVLYFQVAEPGYIVETVLCLDSLKKISNFTCGSR